ncbi:hypothetical protein LTR22_012011 [Elasticomyces elasticus]|nr:hypothetical protein LTR22_012011 [Elasticomyces elasticus]KAK4930198.1 hypothetical protein LTR49_003232 [Elasticomyces elasticus]KAK5761361.1 hypothetical protein LTS12_008465 [Elasticomyces elasticus]
MAVYCKLIDTFLDQPADHSSLGQIEGLVTVACVLLVLFLLPDYPSTARFLTEDDKKFVEARIRVKGGGYTNERSTKKEVMETIFSPRMMAHYLAYTCDCVPLGSLTFFSPTIVAGLGYTSVQAQLMVIPKDISQVSDVDG